MTELTKYKEFSPNTPSSNYLPGLYSNPMTQLIRDQNKINENPFIFNHEVTPKFTITDQKSSGRCWLFATLNLVRVVAAQNLDSEPKELEFSQTYLYFWDKLERYHRSIRYYIDIKKNISPELQSQYLNHLYKDAMGDGGQWDMAKDLVAKYGIIPKQAMPDSYHSKSSSSMNALLLEMLKNDLTTLDKSDESIHEELIGVMTDRVYNLLCGFLGKPPKTFDWVYNAKNNIVELTNLTPQSLLALCKFNPEDWVSVVNDPRKENVYNKYYQVQYLGNIKDQHVGWLNLPIERLKELTKQSIDQNKPVWFGCNVGAERDRDSGIMDICIHDYKQIGYYNKMSKEEKLRTFTSLPSHAMVIDGYYNNTSNVIKRWKIENSWGKSSGSDGFLLMTDSWYSEYVYQIVVPKYLLSENELKELDSVHKLISPWDPLGTLA
jgi:bleomycin hydrolase